jgi:hypothetical protein
VIANQRFEILKATQFVNNLQLPSFRVNGKVASLHLHRLHKKLTKTKSTMGPNEIDTKADDNRQKKRKRTVQVLTAAAPFPISKKPKRPPRLESDKASAAQQKDKSLLDWHDTVKEIRNYGATAFVGAQKRNFEKEQYKLLTGREKKSHHVPLPIVRGIKKKAAQRHEKVLQEAKDAGIVLPKEVLQTKKEVKKDLARIYGPAPSVGFMNKGVLKVKDKGR